MTRKWKLSERQRRISACFPAQFAVIVLPLIEKFGDEAKKIIYRTMFEVGLKNGQTLAKKTKKRDLLTFEKLNIEDLIKKGNNLPGFDDPARRWTSKKEKLVIYDHSLSAGCPSGIPQVWKDMGLNGETIKMLGQLYCIPLDTGRRIGFNPKIAFKYLKWCPAGDDYCEFCEEIK